jgi:uncharacterized tellurite resistance protein B-like protein
MIKRILDFFSAETPEPETLDVNDAAAVLLIEVMMADHELDERERECVAQILAERLNCTIDEAMSCIEQALTRHEDSYDMHQFVRVVNDEYDEESRYRLVVDLWKVAFADGRLDMYEDQRIRRIAELMHLHHSHFIRAKAEAKGS